MVTRRLLLPAAVLALALAPTAASADVKHTVARGHTLEAIANRYHVSVRSIVDANHLRDTKHLKVGDTLTIPTAGGSGGGGGAATATAAQGRGSKGKADAHGRAGRGSYAARPKTPGVVHMSRLATKEELTLRVHDRRGRTSPTAAKQIEHVMRSQTTGSAHAIDPRLVALIGLVSDHFGSRKIEVVSGFRPYTPTQYTQHSNHNHGRAIDFRVQGVPNEVVRDFCRTLRNVGCGYYPNSVFVHMDVRAASAYWIDYSKPGEPPRYHAPGVEADEGTSDVHAEVDKGDKDKGEAPAAPSAPDSAPAAPPPAAPPPAAPADGAKAETKPE
ncbi:MAG: DUF882 domain-containing protein [Myxococcales bacterium]|nr:DUF882 domain-containing protein [Myxococcales bacterium]